jgi:hypothetical protein
MMSRLERLRFVEQADNMEYWQFKGMPLERQTGVKQWEETGGTS